MKIEITTSILNGLFKRNRTTVLNAIKSFEGKEVVITIDRLKKKRSNNQMYLIELAKRYGLNNYINLVFRKNFSAQVLKANMKVVGNCEYGLIFYRDKLPKFNNKGKMVFNCLDWERDDSDIEKLHPTQKPLKLLTKLIEIFTDEGDVVIDPCAGSGSTLIAGQELKRRAFGFEIKKNFHKLASNWIDEEFQKLSDIEEFGFAKTLINKSQETLF